VNASRQLRRDPRPAASNVVPSDAPRSGGRIRIVVVDDHEVIRHGVREVLNSEGDMTVVGEAAAGADAIALAEELQPDVMLLDVKLADFDGPEVCERVLAVSPKTAVIMLTSYLQDGVILRSLTAGATGFLIKDIEINELRRTVRSVHRGHSVLDPKVASRVIASVMADNGHVASRKTVAPPRLSDKDLTILRHVAKGLTNKEISELVQLSTHAVKDHLLKIGISLDARTRTEMVAAAMRAGLI
jgi:two-component system, NarL family, response regulator DevR